MQVEGHYHSNTRYLVLLGYYLVIEQRESVCCFTTSNVYLSVSINFVRFFLQISCTKLLVVTRRRVVNYVIATDSHIYGTFYLWNSTYTHGLSVLTTAFVKQCCTGKLQICMFCRKIVGIHEQDFKKMRWFLYKNLTVFTGRFGGLEFPVKPEKFSC